MTKEQNGLTENRISEFSICLIVKFRMVISKLNFHQWTTLDSTKNSFWNCTRLLIT